LESSINAPKAFTKIAKTTTFTKKTLWIVRDRRVVVLVVPARWAVQRSQLK
jgi:hypothetical protein